MADASQPQPAPPVDAPRHPLDVRPVLARGEEPFGRIMGAVDELPEGGVLVLETPFDPVPLHRVLGGKGFAHRTRTVEAGHFSTEYWREAPAGAPGAAAETAATVQEGTGTVVLDVRGLQPPEPMERTLAVLETLPDGARLEQINERVPAFLLPLLDERGFTYAITEDERGTVTTVWRAS
jgi:uncharacterized protein (DUF2249 family)